MPPPRSLDDIKTAVKAIRKVNKVDSYNSKEGKRLGLDLKLDNELLALDDSEGLASTLDLGAIDLDYFSLDLED